MGEFGYTSKMQQDDTTNVFLMPHTYERRCSEIQFNVPVRLVHFVSITIKLNGNDLILSEAVIKESYFKIKIIFHSCRNG